MVCDCRRSNCHFTKPDKVRLCTAESLTRIHVPADEKLFIATADLKDAFYHFQRPVALRPFFGMQSLRAGELGLTELRGREVGSFDVIYPRLKVLPMGWSHAFLWCQKLHQAAVGAVGAGPDNRLEDRMAVPHHSCMHLEYVDNLLF